MAVNARLQLAGEERDELIRRLRKLEGDKPGQMRQETACIHILVPVVCECMRVSAWLSDWVCEGWRSKTASQYEGGRERVHEWVSQWVHAQLSACLRESRKKGGSDSVSMRECMSEWVGGWVSHGRREGTSQCVNDGGSAWVSEIAHGFENSGYGQILEIAPNSLKCLLNPSKMISIYLRDCLCRFRVNSRGSKFGRFWARGLGHSPWFWKWRIWASPGNRSKLPEMPPKPF